MSERNRRGGRRERENYRNSRDFSQREYGRQAPWREESSGGSHDPAYGHGYGYGFSDSSSYRRPNPPGRMSEHYEPDDQRWMKGQWERDRDRQRDDPWDRSRATGGYGSEFGAWRSGVSFGLEPSERRDDRDYSQRYGYGQADVNSGRMGPDDSYAWDHSPGRPAHSSHLRDDYRGRTPKDYRRSDERIREEVCDRLTDDPYVDPSDVSIKVESGEVILTGFVATRDQKRRTEEDAERVTGVRDVINQLRLSRGDQPAAGTSAKASGQRSSSTTSLPSVAADR